MKLILLNYLTIEPKSYCTTNISKLLKLIWLWKNERKNYLRIIFIGFNYLKYFYYVHSLCILQLAYIHGNKKISVCTKTVISSIELCSPLEVNTFSIDNIELHKKLYDSLWFYNWRMWFLHALYAHAHTEILISV